MRHEDALAHVAPAPAPPPPDFAGTWQNQLGSTMTLKVEAGKVSGET